MTSPARRSSRTTIEHERTTRLRLRRSLRRRDLAGRRNPPKPACSPVSGAGDNGQDRRGDVPTAPAVSTARVAPSPTADSQIDLFAEDGSRRPPPPQSTKIVPVREGPALLAPWGAPPGLIRLGNSVPVLFVEEVLPCHSTNRLELRDNGSRYIY